MESYLATGFGASERIFVVGQLELAKYRRIEASAQRRMLEQLLKRSLE